MSSSDLHIKDEELLRQFSNGSDKAFAELYKRYYAKLLYYIKQSTPFEEAQCKDILQDVFVKVIKAKQRFDSRRKFSTWIYAICHHTCINEIKKSKTKEKNVAELKIRMEENHESKQAITKSIRTALKDLNPIHKQVFLLRFNFACSIKEIAEILDISEGTVKSRLHYCLQSLSQQKNIKESIQS